MKTLVNFRDAGGYQTADGRKVKRGKIYRSGEIVDLSTEDKEKFVNQYGIKTIFDLRGASELAERPDDVFTGTNYINLDIMKDLDGQSSSLEDLTAEPTSADDHMKFIYRGMVLSKSGQSGYRQFLEQVASGDDPFIFHCFAGKDRTGVAAALVLDLLEVSKADIYDDYLKTNQMRQAANDLMIAGLREKGMDEEQLKEVETMMYVKKEYLDVAYETMDVEFGGLRGFVKDGLGLSDNLVKDLKTLYTV